MLTDTACRKAVPGERDQKLADAFGLFLLVRPSGHKSWRYKFRFAGKEKQLVIGSYPATSLKEARQARDSARQMLDAGIDPAAAKQQRKAAASAPVLDSFEAMARVWHKAKAPSLASRYAGQLLDRLEADVFPSIGKHPVRSITPPMVLELVRAIEARGAREMAHRVRMHISDVFVWAIASGLAEQDPAAIIRKALMPTLGKLRPAVLKLPHARSVILSTELLPNIHWATRLASRLLALTAARPGVVGMAERHEFEGLNSEAPIWRIPASKMKLTRERKRDEAFEFVMPLARQSVELVQLAMQASPDSTWLFPAAFNRRKPINPSTLSKHYRDAGLTGRHVPHGWRATFSTIMNELAATEDRERDRAIIDMMLAHMPEGVEAAYNRAAYMPRRRALAQAWADMLLEGLPPASTLVPHLQG